MKNDLLKVAIRQNAVFILKDKIVKRKNIAPATTNLLANFRKVGYTVSEELLHAFNTSSPANQLAVFELLKDILGTKLNWASLVKGWDKPTGESIIDHLITQYVNYIGSKNGAVLACGHVIPDNTFPLERYNGCPFCGTPFQLGKIENYGQGSKLKVLELWSEEDMNIFFKDLLESRTALDATQVDSLKILLKELPMPTANIGMKETLMLVIDILIENGEGDKAAACFSTPTDILRYLWYKKTGFLQIVEPKTILTKTKKNNFQIHLLSNKISKAAREKNNELKLKYNRETCRMVATWINNLNIDVEKACEMMHPKRGMWVRLIRALRLAEYSKKEGFEYLKKLLDIFYNQTYTVWQGEVNSNRLKLDVETTFNLLKQRPGMFARSLFANMLWFGADETLNAFEQVIDKLPARLIFTLGMYAKNYFDAEQTRTVKPLGGNAKNVPANKYLELYSKEQLADMVEKVKGLCLKTVSNRFANVATESKTMFIEPMLFNIPLSIGDRSETIQDASCALMGTRFPIEGDTVRLFMQWGVGLPAQHLDMDLSCHIAYNDRTEVCSYFNLVAKGAKHSGDIRSIPNKKGTAEYVELDVNVLRKAKAEYVIFTCNAYSAGAISPNLVVGWMNSANPMEISEKTGVAYDPSCVQHQVRVSQGLTKGLVFGILNVHSAEITWLEMPFGGQTVANMDAKAVTSLLNKLKSKISIGELLTIKAEAQAIELVETAAEADEVYTNLWALNTAAVTKLLID